jgi:hypothetical protein
MQINEKFEKAFSTLKDKREDDYMMPVTEDRIRGAEVELDVVFPDSYKVFLREIGSSYWPNYFIGLNPLPVPATDVISITFRQRQVDGLPLPHYLIPIEDDGYGNYYCLDSSKMKDSECPVVFWNHDLSLDQTPEWIAASYIDWLYDQVNEALAIDAEYEKERNNS